MYVPACDDNLDEDFSKNVWSDVSKWFSRENIDKATHQGIYRIVEDNIWFTVITEYPSHTVIVDYFGTFSEDRLLLKSFSHPLGYQIKEKDDEAPKEFIRLDILNNP